ncbi:MAG: protein-L-isoaspartate(D-aspartate) O-methyltransferase [Candidatus Competibacteraceae bacterium]|jgi:protein-L-isoaspartate(D-aspartate) O-methyltransferase
MVDGLAAGLEAAWQTLLNRVAAEIRETGAVTGCPALSAPVRQALATVPRHRFVADEQRGWAYADMPLPIGRGQTISQPFIVALMTELLALDPAMTILEIGAGSGYQTAVLAQLARQVYSVERIPELAEAAAQRWREMGIENVAIRVGDGGQGWEEYAPFDGIMVTAAATDVPPALVRQLKPGGRLVIPVGEPGYTQDLRVIHKDPQGVVFSRSALPVVFVPLIQDRD